MSRQRLFSDEECFALAQWFNQLRSLGTVRGKCRDLECSKGALMDAIARGNGTPRRAMREKLSSYQLAELSARLREPHVPRETVHSGQIDDESETSRKEVA